MSRTLSFEEALSVLQQKLSSAQPIASTKTVPLAQSLGRVLAADVVADRNLPPFNRSTRDGFALRSADASAPGAVLKLTGEVRAGEHFEGTISSGECVQIMTGAPLPSGADAVAMIEHVQVQDGRVELGRAASAFENVVREGSEARANDRVLARGRRIGAGEIGLLASVGQASIQVFRKPSVAILPTGDEIVPVENTPQWFEIRNSNSAMLAAQVIIAGGTPLEISAAPDRKQELRRRIEQALEADLIVLSGGVSAGKYDFVESVLGELGAEFYFESVAIRPGKPVVFGRAQSKFFFGLPGNPVSSFVTFELFARRAIEMLGGSGFAPPVFLRARIGSPVRSPRDLTTFMPARVKMRGSGPEVNLVGWQGSGDLVGTAQANCFMVIHPGQQPVPGDWVDVLPRSLL